MTTPNAQRTFLVTGAGRGLGRAAAQALGAHGARVMINDINPDSAAETARLVEAAGGQASVHITDISKKFPVQALLNAVEDTWGRLDGVVNNARVVPHKPLLDMDEWDWRRTLDVNLTGAYLLTQVAGRILRASGGGQIIQLLQQPADEPGLTAYHATCGALESFAAEVAGELERAGVQFSILTYRRGVYGEAVQAITHLLFPDYVGK